MDSFVVYAQIEGIDEFEQKFEKTIQIDLNKKITTTELIKKALKESKLSENYECISFVFNDLNDDNIVVNQNQLIIDQKKYFINVKLKMVSQF